MNEFGSLSSRYILPVGRTTWQSILWGTGLIFLGDSLDGVHEQFQIKDLLRLFWRIIRGVNARQCFGFEVFGT